MSAMSKMPSLRVQFPCAGDRVDEVRHSYDAPGKSRASRTVPIR
ncbi:unnamed protein product [Ectocarpus sp. CCAP 1310/34]|nr:unnamed protein product [Ectocarpus sp. CCAP 1310/34]